MKVLISTSNFCEFSNSPIEILLRNKFHVIKNPYGRKMTSDEIIDLAEDVDFVIAGTERYDSELFNKLSNLKTISRVGVGIDNIDLEFAKNHGINILKTNLSPSLAVAEFAITLILSDLKRLIENIESAKSGKWKKKSGFLLSNKIIGIVGAGNIGKRFIQLLSNFNNRFLIFDKYEDKDLKKEKNISYVSIKEVFKKSDIISIHLPLTTETKYLVDSKLLKLIKDDSLLVNTSRGEIIKEEDLFKILSENSKIRAALDVFEFEPYNGPLMKLDNVTLTPHISAYARETRVEMELEAVQNLIDSI